MYVLILTDATFADMFIPVEPRKQSEFTRSMFIIDRLFLEKIFDTCSSHGLFLGVLGGWGFATSRSVLRY